MLLSAKLLSAVDETEDDPDWLLAALVGICIGAVRRLNEQAIREGWSDAEVDDQADIYQRARRHALSIPPRGDIGHAAVAILVLADMRRETVRADNDLAGMAFLGLAEDLIARVI